MEKDKIIEELNARVSQLEDENRQLQSMLEKVIKKYKKLKPLEERQSKKKKTEPIPNLLTKTEENLSAVSLSSQQSMNNTSLSLIQNIEIDNLQFIQTMITTITVNYYFESGTYLIHEAVKAGAIKILHYLCKNGADMNIKSKAGESPLTLGAEENKHDAMCIILQHGRQKLDLEYHNPQGSTALQIAVKNGNKEIVSLLIAHGANVNVTNMLGDSLIKVAQRCGNQEIVLLLVNAGASLR